MTPDSSEPKGFLDKPENVKRLLNIFYVLCGLSLVAEFFAHRHIDHPWEALPEFYPVYGFFGIIILVGLSVVLRKLVMRGEDYYDE